MARAFAEIAFTPTVRAAQAFYGSAKAYGKFLTSDADAGNRLGPRETQFIEARDSAFQATVSETGWHYVQHRGGPRGFLKVLDDSRVAYADLSGNRQYVSLGNLQSDDRVSLILVDYPNQARLKIWGRVSFVEIDDDPGLVTELAAVYPKARPERAVMITIEAFDWNCPQHIPQRLTAEEYDDVLAPLRSELESLRAENAQLKAATIPPG